MIPVQQSSLFLRPRSVIDMDLRFCLKCGGLWVSDWGMPPPPPCQSSVQHSEDLWGHPVQSNNHLQRVLQMLIQAYAGPHQRTVSVLGGLRIDIWDNFLNICTCCDIVSPSHKDSKGKELHLNLKIKGRFTMELVIKTDFDVWIRILMEDKVGKGFHIREVKLWKQRYKRSLYLLLHILPDLSSTNTLLTDTLR